MSKIFGTFLWLTCLERHKPRYSYYVLATRVTCSVLARRKSDEKQIDQNKKESNEPEWHVCDPAQCALRGLLVTVFNHRPTILVLEIFPSKRDGTACGSRQPLYIATDTHTLSRIHAFSCTLVYSLKRVLFAI